MEKLEINVSLEGQKINTMITSSSARQYEKTASLAIQINHIIDMLVHIRHPFHVRLSALTYYGFIFSSE